MPFSRVLTAFLLTLLAGLSTGIGGATTLFCRKADTRFLGKALSFAAGVMLYVSFVEILAKGQSILLCALGLRRGAGYATLAFFLGLLATATLDQLLPQINTGHPGACSAEENTNFDNTSQAGLARMGLMSALAIAVHNFPEGLATFTSALQDPKLGVAIAVAIAIHNIPEGIVVAVPIYYATGNKKQAFWLALFTGLFEPVGALVGYLLLAPFLNEVVFGLAFMFIAGIMVFISLAELLPAARQYADDSTVNRSLLAGMAVMATSLLLFM